VRDLSEMNHDPTTIRLAAAGLAYYVSIVHSMHLATANFGDIAMKPSVLLIGQRTQEIGSGRQISEAT
jgi:hypothetical protein